jgi:prephenate dehydrogenase
MVCSADDHDRWVAHSSHLPQLLATTLAQSLGEREDREAVLGAAGPGLASMTRLAMSGWPIWKDILATNSDYIAEALEEYRTALSGTIGALNSDSLEQNFKIAAEFAARAKTGQS